MQPASAVQMSLLLKKCKRDILRVYFLLKRSTGNHIIKTKIVHKCPFVSMCGHFLFVVFAVHTAYGDTKFEVLFLAANGISMTVV